MPSWPTRPDGSIDIARWLKMWQVVLDDFEKPSYAATVETVAEENLILATLLRNQLSVLTTPPSAQLQADADSNVKLAEALFETAKKTADPSALFLGVAYPLAFQGNKSAVHRTATIANQIKGHEPTYGLGAAIEESWDESVAKAGALATTVGEYLGKGIEAAASVAKSGVGGLAIGIGAVVAAYLLFKD